MLKQNVLSSFPYKVRVENEEKVRGMVRAWEVFTKQVNCFLFS